MDKRPLPEWYRDAKFGVFIHWGVYSVPAGYYQGKPVKGIGELIMNKGKIPMAEYQKFAQHFTGDNPKTLAPAARDAYLRARGTALERQELEGVLVEGAENALWDREMLDACRLTRMPRDEDDRPIVNFARVVVAIDAAGSDNEDSDQTGIVVAALGDDGHGYVLEDLSGKYKPEVWAKRALSAYNRHMADKIVAETNHGGDMIRAVVQAVSTEFNYGTVRASRGKVVRAELTRIAERSGT